MFSFAPYLWAAGLEGDMDLGPGLEVHVDASFLDLIDHFDIGFMGVGEARYNQFGFFTDLMYMKLSAGKKSNAGPGVSVELTSETFTLLGAAEYRLIDEDSGSLDALAGARVWWLNNELDLSGGGPGFSGSVSETWVDPIIGLRGRMNLSPEFFLTSWAMIGGFGVSSDFTWDVMGGVGYNLNDTVSLVAGYRGLGVDYELTASYSTSCSTGLLSAA